MRDVGVEEKKKENIVEKDCDILIRLLLFNYQFLQSQFEKNVTILDPCFAGLVLPQSLFIK